MAARPDAPRRLLLAGGSSAVEGVVRSALTTGLGGGVELVHVPDAARAAEALREQGSACILLHVDRGDAALAALDRLLAAAPHIPVVVLGEDEAGGIALAALRRGAEEHVAIGSWTPEALSRAVLAAIERRRAVMERDTAEALLAETQALTRSILDSLEVGAVALDGEGVVFSSNEPWRRHPLASACGGRWGVGSSYLELCERLVDEGGLEMGAAGAVSAVARGGRDRFEAEVHITGRHGDAPGGAVDRWYTLTALPLAGRHGAVVTHSDSTRRRAREAALVSAASTDSLTGLPNGEAFLRRLGDAVARAARTGSCVAVVLVGIDGFKALNDSLGHRAGDGILREAASRIVAALGPYESAARRGGDEFAIVCEGISGLEDAEERARRLVATVSSSTAASPARGAPGEVPVRASAGVSLGTGRDAAAEELVAEADAAMYRAKEQGGGRVASFREGMRRRAQERLGLERDLRLAMSEGRLTLAFQPIVSVATGRIIGAESLLRWPRDDGRTVSPADFIPLAEQTGLIEPLGRWVLTTACARLAELVRSLPGAADLGMTVNLSGVQLTRERLEEDVARALGESGCRPEAVCLEITETALTRDLAAAAANLDAARTLGVSVALDDFGTGYSSLQYAKHFRVNVIKIDKSFVDGVGRGGADAAIVRSIVSLAHTLGARVVAEGVEEEGQLAALSALGCDAVQGFYLSKPLLFPDFVELCRRERAWWERAGGLRRAAAAGKVG